MTEPIQVVIVHPHLGLALVVLLVVWLAAWAIGAWMDSKPQEDPEVTQRREDTARHLASLKGKPLPTHTNWMKR